MKKTGRALCFIILALLPAMAGMLPASDAEVSAGINAEKIGLDDTLIYTLSFVNIENPTQPDLSYLDDFKTLQTSRSSEFQFRDGTTTSAIHFVYYLMPTRTGKLTLPPVVYHHQGREYRTQAFSVEVVKGSLGAKNSSQPAQSTLFDDDFFSSPTQSRPPQKVDAYLRSTVSKKSCFKGEQLLFRVLLYTRSRIAAVNMLSSTSFAGFWQEWFPVPQSIAATSENVNGVIYQVYEVRKAALFASESGNLAIPSLQFELELADPGAAFFGAQPLRRSTPEVKITVKEPPPAAAGLPVGQFNFSLAGPQVNADTNEIITLQMKITGSGNSKAIIPPALSGNDQFQTYAPKITQEISYAANALTGTLRAEIPVSFHKAGEVTIPGLEFKYFNPTDGGMVSLRSLPLRIEVSGEKRPTDLSHTLPRSAILQKGEDIDFIKSGSLHDPSRHLYRQKWFAALIILFFACNLLALLKIFLWDRHVAASALLRNRQILGGTLRRLAGVRHLEEIAPLMESYFSAKSGMGFAEINDRKIADVLHLKGVPAPTIDRFLFIKGQSEVARFSPHKKSALELKKDLQALRDLLKEIDRKMK
jgi:hypothetical protein